MLKIKLAILLLVVLGVGFYVYDHNHGASADQTVVKTATSAKKEVAKTVPPANYCAANSLAQNIIVSIGKQHLWACEKDKSVYDSAVITGMEKYPADLTPTGTYHIYGKQTGQYLAGHDGTGSWDDYVNYWLPFLDNQYGTYGFHDLTQTANGANGRVDSDFGNININAPYTAAKHGSHGCVELPLATAKWLYDWSVVGTTVIIQS